MPVPSTSAVSSPMSAAVSIAPAGLCGELRMIIRVRGVTAPRTASQSMP